MVAGGAVGPFGRHTARSLADIANDAIVEAVAAARVARSDIAAAFVGNAFGGAITDQESILAQTLLAPAGIAGIPMRTIKNACSSGADAVHLGWSAIAYGQYDCVLVLGAEKLTHDDRLARVQGAGDRDRSCSARRRPLGVCRHQCRPRQKLHGAIRRHAGTFRQGGGEEPRTCEAERPRGGTYTGDNRSKCWPTGWWCRH